MPGFGAMADSVPGESGGILGIIVIPQILAALGPFAKEAVPIAAIAGSKKAREMLAQQRSIEMARAQAEATKVAGEAQVARLQAVVPWIGLGVGGLGLAWVLSKLAGRRPQR